MFDETTHMSHASQLCLVDHINENYTIQEDFFGFIDPLSYNFENNSEIKPKLSGKIFEETVLKLMNNFTLDLNNCVGIATDSCNVIAWKCVVQ